MMTKPLLHTFGQYVLWPWEVWKYGWEAGEQHGVRVEGTVFSRPLSVRELKMAVE
jgi:hypothetical protein